MYSNNLQYAFGGAFLLIILIVLAISVTISVLYLLNLQNLLKEIDPKNRTVEPGNVWLMFIPLFNFIYPFILYPKIAESTKAEYASRGLEEQGDFGRGIGITMPILSLCGWIPILGSLAGIANLVLFIIYWVKTAGFKTTLLNTPKAGNVVSASAELLD